MLDLFFWFLILWLSYAHITAADFLTQVKTRVISENEAINDLIIHSISHSSEWQKFSMAKMFLGLSSLCVRNQASGLIFNPCLKSY